MEAIKLIPLKKIRVPEWAKRLYISEEEVNKLAEDIKRRGQVRPIKVRKINCGEYEYELVYGYRTYLGLEKAEMMAKAEVAYFAERRAVLEHLAENGYHKDLHPLDLARKIDYAMKLGISQAEIARACNTTVDVIKKLHRLNSLPDWFKEEVRRRTLNVKWSLLYELLRAVDYPFFKEVAEKFLGGELATEKAIRDYIDSKLEPCRTPEEAREAGRIVPELIAREVAQLTKITLDDLPKVGEREGASTYSIRRCDYCGKPMARDEFAWIIVHRGTCENEAKRLLYGYQKPASAYARTNEGEQLTLDKTAAAPGNSAKHPASSKAKEYTASDVADAMLQVAKGKEIPIDAVKGYAKYRYDNVDPEQVVKCLKQEG